MGSRRINFLMLIFSLIGGIIGFFAGELILARWTGMMPGSILMGIYFGQFALWVGLMCLLAEMISPILNSRIWRTQYVGSSWKMLLPCTLLILFVGGAALQFIYDLNLQKLPKVNDVVLLIDMSQSMTQSDPDNKRLEAVKELVSSMPQENRAAVFTFNEGVVNIQPMSNVTDDVKKNISEKLDQNNTPQGRTDIKLVLNEAIKHIRDNKQPDRAAMVLLLSDGEDTFGLESKIPETMEPYREERIPVYTIGLDKGDIAQLKKLSNQTGGNYYSVDKAEKLNYTFGKIYRERDMRLLMGERNGRFSGSAVYAIMRVLFITLLGILLGLSVGLVFDNKFIAKGLMLGGLVSGLLAGLLLEFGFRALPWAGSSLRLTADAILAAIFTLFTLAVELREQGGLYGKARQSSVRAGNASSSFDKNRNPGRRSF